MSQTYDFSTFRKEFIEMVGRFATVAPTLVRSGAASGAIALQANRVAGLLVQSMPADDGGALNDGDLSVLAQAMERAGALMSTTESLSATLDFVPPSFDERLFPVVTSLSETELPAAIDLVATGSAKGLSSKEQTDLICKIAEAFGGVFTGSIFEAIKKLLMIVLQVLAGRTVLPQKIVDLIPTIFKIIDDLIPGDGGETVPPTPPEILPPPVQPPAICELCLLLVSTDAELTVQIPAGQRAIVSLDLTSDPNDRGILGITSGTLTQALTQGQSSGVITGPQDLRLKFSSAMVRAGKVRIRFV